MKKRHLSKDGACEASIKSAQELMSIRNELHQNTILHQTVRWIEAIKDPTRFRLVALLHWHHRLCVCDLANILMVSSSAVSQHLRRLRDMRLVSVERQKQTMFYALCSPEFETFISQLIPEDEVSYERNKTSA